MPGGLWAWGFSILFLCPTALPEAHVAPPNLAELWWLPPEDMDAWVIQWFWLTFPNPWRRSRYQHIQRQAWHPQWPPL